MGTTIVGAIGGAMVGAVEARGLWVHDVLRPLWGFVVANIDGVSRKNTATFHASGLGLARVRAKAPEDVSSH